MLTDMSLPLSTTEVASAFAALGSEQRLAILEALVRSGPSGLMVGELGEKTGVYGSTLTHHLKILTAAGLLQQQKKGRSTVCAAVAYDVVESLSKYLLRNCCLDVSNSHTCKDHMHV